MSTLSLRKIKHDSASVDNVTLNTDGGVGIGGIDPSTLPTFIDHAVRVQNGGGLGIQSANATDNRWIFFGHGTANLDVQRAGIVNQGSDQSLALATGGTQRLIVDASGRVTMPFQPAFSAATNAVKTMTNSADFVFDRTWLNRGNCYSTSTGRFTAPVTGVYTLTFEGLINISERDTVDVRFFVNGAQTQSSTIYQVDYGGSYRKVMMTSLMSLTANDYVGVRSQSSGGSFDFYGDAGAYLSESGGGHTGFKGYLIG